MLYVLLRALKLWDYGEWKFQIIKNVWNITNFRSSDDVVIKSGQEWSYEYL